ncbi:MAG TPA: carcinine hydrolase/isopenicillin-N N-acyltransferase family protein [Spirochaetia bacterium]|nr:carcinine hydrolase/isopenicillin-N N-acyltransferase family protein [Spirochaetales bacterium]HRY78810.1 carcinine hydrolase/isopenicillin-N N-acyltransferase family protein [Spirochaetia bacterium]
MCDTFWTPGAGLSYFGKNSDRKPAEPQAVCILPRAPEAPRSAVSGGELPYPDKGYAVLLSKPSWIRGAEIGLNEKGVAIGNEAVFSKWPARKDGILGMDFLRIALRSASTAQEAVEILVELTERFDQGGNGAYRGRLFYHNSYLAAGFDGAFVLETAGKRWAWRKAEGPSAISNSYSIGLDYKRLDAQTRKAISPVNEKMACYDEADAGRIGEKESWKPYVESRLHAFLTQGDSRRRAVEGRLAAAGPGLDLAVVLDTLRSRSLPDPARPGKTAVICAHDGDNLGYPTTASLAVEYDPRAGRCVAWFTGTSYPDISLYKPVLLSKGEFTPLWTGYDYSEDAPASLEYWKRGRDLYRRGGKALSPDPEFRKARDSAQERLREAAGRVEADGIEAVRKDVARIVSDWEASFDLSGRGAPRQPSA